MLTREQETELVTRAQSGDTIAQNQLVLAHKGIIGKLAGRYARLSGISQPDLFGWGTIGFLDAIRHYTPDLYEGRFLSFAGTYIRSEMLDHIIADYSLIKVATTNADRKAFFRLRREQAQLRARLGCEPSAELLADRMGVNPADVEYMQGRFERPILSMDSRAAGIEGEGLSLHDTCTGNADPESAIADNDAVGYVRKCMIEFEQLGLHDDRERAIWNGRIACDSDDRQTLQAIGDRLGCTKEYVRQIEDRLRERFVDYCRENDAGGSLN